MTQDNATQKEASITEMGNPRKPEGDAGSLMLQRMNESHADVTAWAFSFLDINPNDTVLDIGCGGGAALARLSKKIASGHLTGIDYSPVSVSESRSFNAADVATEKMNIIEGSVAALPFDANTFDKIVTVESFYFWPEPVENLKEVYRVLKEGGVFLLTADIYQKDGLDATTLENIQKYNLRNPTSQEFQTMFLQAGFQNIVIHTESGTDWISIEGHK